MNPFSPFKLGAAALLAAAAFALAPAKASALEIESSKFEDCLDADGAVFGTEADSFLNSQKNKFLFKWQTDKKEECHFPAWGNSPKLLFMGFQIHESNIKFKDGKLNSVYVSFFNRGDAESELKQEGFNKLIADVDAKISEWAGGDKGTPLKNSRLNSEAKILAKAWIKGPYALTLKWSSTGNSKKDFVAEYVQLEIEKFDPKDDPRKQTVLGISRDSMATAKSLPENLKKEENGDVFIDKMPMVDQGPKGYCVDASVARVLNYYGMEVSMHDIAQIAGSGKEGTIVKALLSAVKMLSSRYGVKLRQYYKGPDLDKLLSKYNSAAKKAKSPPASFVMIGSNMVDLGETLARMSPDVYTKMRMEGAASDVKSFQKDVKDTIDRGVPLLWSVFLGMVKEEKITPQMRGGHMRLIIGYNEKEKQIVYTDSWGAEHAFKKMSFEDAWVISDGLFSLDPLK